MNIVILAAGQGKRMKSALPKVLQTLAGKPLLQHVLNTALSLQDKKSKSGPVVVVGHGAADVKTFLLNISKEDPSFGKAWIFLAGICQEYFYVCCAMTNYYNRARFSLLIL